MKRIKKLSWVLFITSLVFCFTFSTKGFIAEASLIKDDKISIMAVIADSFELTMRQNAVILMSERSWDIQKGTYPLLTGEFFASKVRSGGAWDYKRSFGANTLYSFDGRTMSGEDLGNMHYGFAGKGGGFSDTVLLAAAGAYQIYSGTSYIGWHKSYFDDPSDQANISLGLWYYNNVGQLPSSLANIKNSINEEKNIGNLNIIDMSFDEMEENAELLLTTFLSEEEIAELKAEFEDSYLRLMENK